uniref:Phospholipid/glycerol acyltransferase domain-containing protein n=1 Tax=Colobus angolensis palliatus TaxID=336983 RepID=A0A2K5JV04_COLAP
MEGAELILSAWLTLVLSFILLRSVFGVSLGISEIYMKILVKTLEWATIRIEKGTPKESILKTSASVGIIQRDESPMEKGDFELSDMFYFSKKGLEAIVEDEVTQKFSSEELVSWKLLTRTNVNFQYISLRLTMVWVLGDIVRYCVPLPLRVTLAFVGVSLLVIGTTLVGQLEMVHLTCCRICPRSLSGTIHYHNKQYRPQKGGICVANHTSLIDILILTTGGCYAMVGQVLGSLMRIIQRVMVKACPHVWFECSEMKDRHLVTKRLKEHIGSFEIGGTIHPVAIKYNPQFGDAFWNSSKYNMVSYLWAIVGDVWYMPPITRKEGEDTVQFANRVKSAIAIQGGLTELPWDGGLKRAKVKDTFKEGQQKNYSKMIVGNGSPNL